MKVRGRRLSAFIVSRCLEFLMEHEARVFDMTSQSRLKIQYNKAIKISVFPTGMVNSSCKSLRLLSHVSSVRDSMWSEASFGRQKWRRGVEST